MDVYECIRTRVAVRSFTSEPVPEPVIKKILRAGRWAPSQRNRQPWHFIVIRDRQTLNQLASLTSSGSYIAGAPLAILTDSEMDVINSHGIAYGILHSGQQSKRPWGGGIGLHFELHTHRHPPVVEDLVPGPSFGF